MKNQSYSKTQLAFASYAYCGADALEYKQWLETLTAADGVALNRLIEAFWEV